MQRKNTANKSMYALDRFVRAFFAVAFAVVLTHSAWGQRLPFIHYRVDEGLPHELVHDIEQDQNGYMWFGTHGGLCRFDGRNFKTFVEADGCRMYHVWALLVDDVGHLWIGTRDHGLVVYDGETFKQIEGVGNRIHVILQDHEGAVWVGAGNGLYRWSEGEVRYFTKKDGLPEKHVNALLQDKENHLWIGTQEGLYRHDGGVFEFQGLEANVREIGNGPDGEFWIGTAKGMFEKCGEAFSPVPFEVNFTRSQISFIRESRVGDLWIGSSAGLFKYSNGGLMAYGVGKGFVKGGCRTLFEDREGNLWFGTTYGVSMLRDEALVSFFDDDIHSVAYHRHLDEVWAAGRPTLYRLSVKSDPPAVRRENPALAAIAYMVEGVDGSMLLATRGDGVFRHIEDQLVPVEYAASEKGRKHIKALYEEPDSGLWLGSVWAGLGYLKPGSFEWYAKDAGLIDTHIHCILRDRSGTLWMGSFNGLTRWTDGEFKHFTTEDGLAGNEVLALQEDDEGVLWIGTDLGLSRLKHGRFETVEPAAPFSSKRCRAIVHAGEYLYIGTPNGLNRLNLETLAVRIYREKDGLAGSTIRPRAMTRDGAGRIWIGTTQGLTRLSPELNQAVLAPPPVYIQQVTLLDGELDPRQPARLQHNNNHLTFEMAGLSYASAGDIRFRYRLNGEGDDWVEAADPHVSFAFLPPGSYVFEVLACNSDGVWSEVPARYEFVIIRPYWKVWWFYALLIVVLGGLASLFYYLRMRRIVRHAEELGRLKSYLSNILDSMPSVLVGVNPQVKITEWNNEATRKTGIPAEQAVGRPLEDIMPELSGEVEQVKQAIETREVVTRSGLARNNGKGTAYEDITIFPLMADGVDGAVIRVDDVTQLTRLQEQFRQAQKMDAVGQLAGGIAHDFNNLLQGILGFSEMAMLDAKGDALENMREAVASTKRASRLTKQLLAFSRRQVLEMKDVELNSAISGLLKMLRHLIGRHIELKISPGGTGYFVKADVNQIGQILTNLCVNARDAMPDGGVITITTEEVTLDETFCAEHTWAKPGAYVLLRVSDTGSGIPEEIMEKIFEPFFTTKEVDKGTGLGLSTIYGLVQQHEGFIDVRSQIGQGAEFRIYFPRIEHAPEQIIKDYTGKPVRPGTETILLVEDDPQVRHIAETTLEKSGYTVLTVNNGQEAIDLIATHSGEIDLVLIDVVTPGIKAEKVYNQLRNARPAARFLFASAVGLENDLTRFIREDHLEFIQKPWGIQELLFRVREILDQ